MADKNDKYTMFRNYMANELGINKADIIEWIKEIIQKEVQNVVNDAYGRCNLQEEIRKAIFHDKMWTGTQLNDKITQDIAREFLDSVDIKISKKMLGITKN